MNKKFKHSQELHKIFNIAMQIWSNAQNSHTYFQNVIIATKLDRY